MLIYLNTITYLNQFQVLPYFFSFNLHVIVLITTNNLLTMSLICEFVFILTIIYTNMTGPMYKIQTI